MVIAGRSDALSDLDGPGRSLGGEAAAGCAEPNSHLINFSHSHPLLLDTSHRGLCRT